LCLFIALQLVASTGLDNTFLLVLKRLVGDTLSNTLGTLPAEGIEALRQVRVREVVAGVHPVGVHGAKVLDLELEERAGELLRVTELLGKSIGLELELAADDVHEKVDDEIHGGEGIREEDESNNDGVLLEETERRVEGVVVDKDREEHKDVEGVSLDSRVSFHAYFRSVSCAYLRDTEEASGVTKLPVTQLVSENSNNLLRLALLDKSIVDDNVLLPGETEEIGVGVGASLASINDVELVEGEFEACSESLDLRLELTILERRQLVEQGQNSDRVNGDHENLESNHEEPQVVEELIASLLDNLEETSEERRREEEGESLGLDKIGNKELGRLLVESEFLLKDKCLVDRRWKTKKLADNGEGQDEDDSVANLASEARRSPLQQKITSPGPELGENIELHECEILNLRV
jgi:hypothetical protein